MNRQTYKKNAEYISDENWREIFIKFCADTVGRYSEIIDAWSVDTCQMWLTGFGRAFDNYITGEDVYWIIPGDFNYASEYGTNVMTKMRELPEAVKERHQDLCIGEIEVDVNSSKQLIDTYGTYGLLYNWFPTEAKLIRKITDKPRSEFFAIGHNFLGVVLQQRWYAYEQTIALLLQGVVANRTIHTVKIGKPTDLPQGRDTLSAAMQQVERTERVLKQFWRERPDREANWPEEFRKLDSQSEQIRGAALVILENLLR